MMSLSGTLMGDYLVRAYTVSNLRPASDKEESLVSNKKKKRS